MEVTEENESQKDEDEHVAKQYEEMDAEHGRVNVMLGRGAKFQRAAPTDTSPRHLDMGDHVLEYPEYHEDLLSDDKVYTQEEIEEAETASVDKAGDRAVEMWRMVAYSKFFWVALGCGLLVIASVVTAAVLAPILIFKGKVPQDTGKPDIDDIVNVSASPPYWTAFNNDNSSAFPTSTLPSFSSTPFTDINECVAQPCGHGSCGNYPGGYRCTCSTGWTGQNCQQDINECTTSTCQHGHCGNYPGGYRCTCSAGWTGKNCHQDVNECTTNPCQHGSCVNKDGGYDCYCHHGWTGTNCHQAIPCNSGWSEYKNNCYKLFKDKVDWSTANGRCKRHGANLASVGSAGENNFIAHLITDAPKGSLRYLVWFGLTLGVDGQWKWTDGSRVSYTNWAKHEPGRNVFGRKEKCGNIYSKESNNWILRSKGKKGEWNDDDCFSHFSYVCEAPK
ncbi:hypothetical protein Bbelb_084280 [Branchiostoma belcheri]|nr:hypothetical protein Bbelb_084280 [Branchiostoma belcheri]